MKVWRVHRNAAPTRALELDELEDPMPGPGELCIGVRAAALNFNDTEMCRGIYPTIRPPLPFALGTSTWWEGTSPISPFSSWRPKDAT